MILAGLMLAVVTNTLNLWQRTLNSFTSSTQTGLVFDLIERDLQAALSRRDGNTWLALDVINNAATLVPHGWLTISAMKPATSESLRPVPDLGNGSTPLIGNARFGLTGNWLRFITTNLEADRSLPIAVSYQIARRPLSGSITATNPAEARYTLFRSVVSEANTFSTAYDVTAAGYTGLSVSPAASRDPKTLMNRNNSNALATNVVDFRIWLYVREAVTGGLRRIYPADNNDLTHAAHTLGPAPDADSFPEVADVMIRIMSDQGAALLAEMENGGEHLTRPAIFGSDAEGWWGRVEANSQVHVRRIAVKGISP